MKKNLLVINKNQFGHHTDYFYFCTILREYYTIDYLCFDQGLNKIEDSGINVHYIPRSSSIWFNGLLFYVNSIFLIIKLRCDILVNYFYGCQILKIIFPSTRMILDLRTFSVNFNETIRIREDSAILKATSYFDHVTVISEGLLQKFNLNKRKTSIVELSSEVFYKGPKTYEDLKLLYVGAIDGRKVEDTIHGLALYIRNSGNREITYDIVGSGKSLSNLNRLIDEYDLRNNIKLHGYVKGFELVKFFAECNVGISYVPVTSFYNFQPVTKTFEYLKSGLVCIATNTHENLKVINSDNGIICCDNPSAFAKSIESLFQTKGQYRTEIIRSSVDFSNWENIVKNQLMPVLMFTK